MTSQLDDSLPRLFEELADAHDVGEPPPIGTLPLTNYQTRRRPRWQVPAVAATTIALVAGGLWALSTRGRAPATGTQPVATSPATSVPVTFVPTTAAVDVDSMTILAPRPNSEWKIASLRATDLSGQAAGAVVAPDDTVFALSVVAHPSWPPDLSAWTEGTTERDVRRVAGVEVAAQVSELADSVVSRTVRDDCWWIGVTTGGEEMWSADFETLLGGLAVDDDGGFDEAPVEFALPDGWRSLGSARMITGWSMYLQPSDGADTPSIHVAQVPNAPIGYLVGGLQDTRSIQWTDRERWEMSNPGTGESAVVGYSATGPFRISSTDLTLDELHQLAEDLVLTPTDDLPVTPDTVVDEVTPATIAPPATGCGDMGTGLEILEP